MTMITNLTTSRFAPRTQRAGRMSAFVSILFVALLTIGGTASLAQVSQIQLLPEQADNQDVYGGGDVIDASGTLVAAYVENGVFTNFPEGTPAKVYITRSTDGGETWSARELHDTAIPNDGVQGIGSPDLFLLDSGEIYLTYWYKTPNFTTIRKNYTSEDGITWNQYTASSNGGTVTPWGITPSGTLVGVESVYGDINDKLHVSTSSDQGVNWTRGAFLVDSDFGVCTPSLFVDTDDHWVMYFTECAFGYGGETPTYRIETSDAGATWSTKEQVMTSGSGYGTYAQVLKDVDGTTLWLLYIDGVNIAYRKSTDGGDTWSDPTNWTFGTETTREVGLRCTPGGTGPWCSFGSKRDSQYQLMWVGVPGVSADPVGVEYDDPGERDFRLDQNYPNPFVGTTTLTFELDSPGDATLTVYDVLGKRVAVLMDARLESGRHVATWNSTGFAPGVYYYHLRTENGTATGSMAVAR